MIEGRFPILGRGETLSEGIPSPPSGGPKRPIRSFPEARDRLLRQLSELLAQAEDIEEDLRLENLFFVVALDWEYLAKSYFPRTLESHARWRFVGSRPWYQGRRDDIAFPAANLSRLLYFCAHPSLLTRALARVDAAAGLSEVEKLDLAKIDSVYLQSTADRLLGLADSTGTIAVELILHPLPASERRKCIEKLRALVPRSLDTRLLETWIRGRPNEPTFLPAVVSQAQAARLGQFNPMRAARPIPGVSFPRLSKLSHSELGPPPMKVPFRAADEAEIGMFDGGVDATLPHLAPWVSESDLTGEPPESGALEHGTGVCGAILYGAITPGAALGPPPFRARSFRVFPVAPEHGIDLDLYKILDWIERVVTDPTNAHIDVYVLSFGPDIPVDDCEVDLFTVVLDRLSYEYDVLFIVAAGNSGTAPPPGNRIQPPADLVNGIGVGAYERTGDGRVTPATYSCVGPGRPGCSIKPDVAAFGGSSSNLFHVLLAGSAGTVVGEAGTSYAAPLVARLAGHLLYRATDHSLISPQTAKALVIHTACRHDGWPSSHGWGAIEDDPEIITTCAPHEVCVLFNGTIDFTRWVRLWLPFPTSITNRGDVVFEWTVVYACDVCAATPDDYTLAGKEIIFRPNADCFSYSRKVDGHVSHRRVDISTEQQTALALEADSWRRASTPMSRGYRREQELREDGKWDTVARGSIRVTNRVRINRPCLDLHAIARADWETAGPGALSYAAVVTIRSADTSVPLYEEVRVAVPQLVPIVLRARARRRTRV